MKIYTRGGDKGKTNIHGGQRVDKDDIRIEANGTLDELNSVLGLIRVLIGEGHEWQEMLFYLQRSLMVVMSHVATPAALRGQNPNRLPEEPDVYCERQIDFFNAKIQYPSTHFILPGGNLVSAQCHVARTVARRASFVDFEPDGSRRTGYPAFCKSLVGFAFYPGPVRNG